MYFAAKIKLVTPLSARILWLEYLLFDPVQERALTFAIVSESSTACLP